MFKQFVRKFQDIFYYKVLEAHLGQCESVLDVGCGSDSPLRMIRKFSYTEGVDIFKPSIGKSKRKKIHDIYTIGDLRKLNRLYKNKSFDAVIALDVVEHFEKTEAVRLMSAMEAIARKKVIVLTPNGFYHQDAYDHNPYQVHRSGWKTKDFTKRGYTVFGLRGIKQIRGEEAGIRYRPWILWGCIAFISEFFLYFFPDLSYDLFAVKTIK